jgi:alpha-tubulin suppressor-like RCC1 family protein
MVTDDMKVVCWGDNGIGQLGDGSRVNKNYPVTVIDQNGNQITDVIGIAVGWQHSCALLGSGNIMCWGYNYNGQLGNNSPAEYSSKAVLVVENKDNTNPLSGVEAITAGFNFTCALLETGGVRCWGAHDLGKLGDGATTDRRAPPTSNIPLGESASAIAAGENHACAVLASGGVKCWGSDAYGQLGNGFPLLDSNFPVSVSGLTGVIAIAAGFLHNCAVSAGNPVVCWGRNEYGELGVDPTTTHYYPSPLPVYDETNALLTNARTVAGGLSYSCALTSDKAIFCWGNNLHGELGNGSSQNSYLAIPISGANFGYMTLASGQNHSCAINNGGGVWCWGANYNGQLGNPDAPIISFVPYCVFGFCFDPILPPDQAIQSIINDQIQPLIDSGALNEGQGNALIAKLDAALEKLGQGNTNAAINLLQAFINQVNGLVAGQKLSSTEGQPLIDSALQVIYILDG